MRPGRAQETERAGQGGPRFCRPRVSPCKRPALIVRALAGERSEHLAVRKRSPHGQYNDYPDCRRCAGCRYPNCLDPASPHTDQVARISREGRRHHSIAPVFVGHLDLLDGQRRFGGDCLRILLWQRAKFFCPCAAPWRAHSFFAPVAERSDFFSDDRENPMIAETELGFVRTLSGGRG